MAKPRVIICGGAGFIGSHTTLLLLTKGFDVSVIDNLSNSPRFILERVEKLSGEKIDFHHCDMRDKQKLLACFAEICKTGARIAGVIHFAAAKAVGESVAKPLFYYENNLVSLLNLLEAMLSHKIANIIFSSSCTVYGQPEKLPVNEKTPFQPAFSPYGNTKQICEEILRDTCCGGDELKVISLRYFNPVGAHESGEIGEIPSGIPNNLAPFITQVAAGIRPELKVFGADYNTPDGTAIRDYIHVVDLGEAHIKALQRLIHGENKSVFEVFNLGAGKGHSVLEVIKSFEKVSGVKVNYRVVDRRDGDIESIWADATLANKELNWQTNLSLDEMLASAWVWEQNYRKIS